jgi:hypothetical protein
VCVGRGGGEGGGVGGGKRDGAAENTNNEIKPYLEYRSELFQRFGSQLQDIFGDHAISQNLKYQKITISKSQ